jgi:hypothetical protein
LEWNEGEPPKPWRGEWFIAETIHGDRVVLRSLPEEWTYDYTTADDTYLMAKNIKRWMQFPDSQFRDYEESRTVSSIESLLNSYLSDPVGMAGDNPFSMARNILDHINDLKEGRA